MGVFSVPSGSPRHCAPSGGGKPAYIFCPPTFGFILPVSSLQYIRPALEDVLMQALAPPLVVSLGEVLKHPVEQYFMKVNTILLCPFTCLKVPFSTSHQLSTGGCTDAAGGTYFIRCPVLPVGSLQYIRPVGGCTDAALGTSLVISLREVLRPPGGTMLYLFYPWKLMYISH